MPKNFLVYLETKALNGKEKRKTTTISGSKELFRRKLSRKKFSENFTEQHAPAILVSLLGAPSLLAEAPFPLYSLNGHLLAGKGFVTF